MANTLVIYFSMTGTTQKVAEEIAQKLGADIYPIVPKIAYSASDLDWKTPTSRANLEQKDDRSRPEFSGELPDMSTVDTVVIGHPTWWGIPPRIVETVLEKLDLSGKTIATFSTSGGSTYAEAQAFMNQLLGHNIVPERVLSSSQSIDNWLKTWRQTMIRGQDFYGNKQIGKKES